MIFELRLLLRSQQTNDRREVLFLVEIEQHLAVVRVLYDGRFSLAVCSKCA